jgi:hypothetical protein
MAIDKLAQNFFERHRGKIAFADPNECWPWTAGKGSKGYGRVRARGKARQAHREAYEAEHGPGSATGLVVRHRCDVRACVNPAHLEIGTVADNNRDMMERGRAARQKGAANGRSKLTEADARAIRAAYVRGCREHGQYALARRYGVGQTVVGKIVRHKLWGHVS